MAQSAHIPDSLHGETTAQATVPRYLYVVKHPELSVYYTNHEAPVEVANLPTAWRHGSPQTFQPVQIQHGQIRSDTEFGDKKTALQVGTNDVTLRRYFLEAPATKIEIAIIRVNASALLAETPGSIDYSRQCQIAQSGTISTTAVDSQVITVEIKPTPFDGTRSVPRAYFGRLCGHMHYDINTCGVGQRNFMIADTIDSIDRATRTVTVASVHAADTFYGGGGAVGGGVFTHGYLFHKDSGQRFGIRLSTFVPATSTSFILSHWMELLEVGDDIEAFFGCNRTVEHCARFNNKLNFGGFPYIPNVNPSLDGLAP